jgi:hypothetical protein
MMPSSVYGQLARNEHRADNPAPIPGRPGGNQAEHARNHCATRLHLKAAVVAWFPLLEEGSVIETEPRRLLGEVDVERSPGERGGDNRRKLPCKHESLHIICST